MLGSAEPRSRAPRRRRRWFPLAVAAFFLMEAAWAMALPVNGTYDEKQHIVRAYAIATGQVLPHGYALDSLGRRTEAYRVPESLLPDRATVDCTWPQSFTILNLTMGVDVSCLGCSGFWVRAW